MIAMESAVRAASANKKVLLTCYNRLIGEWMEKQLEDWISGHPEWRPNVLGQIQSWFKDGLKDRAVTRDLSWGVPIPHQVAQNEKVNPVQ